MKFKLSRPELDYLHVTIHWVLENAPREAEPEAIRAFSKMRWKFGPGAHVVTLGGKERAAISSMLEFRMRTTEGNEFAATERALVSELLGKFV